MIQYITGDATNPQTPGKKIIVHVCNDIGGWGKGFVLALSKKWKEPEEAYRNWFASGEYFRLGAVQFVQVEDDIIVANMIAQHQLGNDENGNPPIRYEAIAAGLSQVTEEAVHLNATVHMPRIGCGLAGGRWEEIEPLINETLTEAGISTTVYDFG